MAWRGQGIVALISGEPGVGKTRLLAELARHARAGGWTVLNGRADETEGMPPYLPWTEALRAHARDRSTQELRGLLGPGAADIAALVPEIGDRVTNLPRRVAPFPEYERYSLFESVTHLLLAIGRSGATPAGRLLVLDDLHWADAPSLWLLLHLARRLSAAPVVVAGAYREAELTPAHPLSRVLADFQRERLSDRLPLGPFSADEVTEFIERVAGPVTPAVARAIQRETEGNPFLVEELLRHLHAESCNLADPRTARGGWGLPYGVRQVIGQRLSRLSPNANRVLQIGAVLGDRWDMDLLAAVCELAFEPLVAALDEAVHAQILAEEGDGYQFTHALVRRTVYDTLLLPMRRRLHLRAAQAIEAAAASNLPPRVAALAAHYRQAGPTAIAQAVDYAQRAAEAARAVYAWEEEAEHRQTALTLLERQGMRDQEQRCDLLLALGDARVRAGEWDQAFEAHRQAAAIARRLHLSDLLARAVLGQVEGLSRAGFQTGRAAEAAEAPVALLEEALQAMGPHDSALCASVLARLALELHMSGATDRSASLRRAALAMARRVGDPATLTVVLHAIHKTLWGPGDLSARLDVTSEMLKVADAAADRAMALSGYNARIFDLLACGDLAALDTAMERYAQLVEDLRQPPLHQHAVTVQHAMRLLLAGQLAEAEQATHAARAIGQQVQCPDTAGCFEGQIFQLRRLQGRLHELDDERQRATEQAPHPWTFCAARALLHSELGHEAAARREFEHLAADGFAILPRAVTWVVGLSRVVQVAEVCAYLGDARRAAPLYERLEPYAGQAVVGGWAVTCAGSAARALGQLAAVMGHWDIAVEHFEAALAMSARMGARPWLAHTQRQYAQLLTARRRRGDRRRARQLLGAALALYADMGMELFAVQTRALLAGPVMAGVSLPAPRFPDRLTAREVEVLALIARGRSNREIGEELVLSVRTVGRHIANIYAKIGAHNKADATAYALRHDLLPTTAHT